MRPDSLLASYANGIATKPLLGQTIGDSLDDVAERFATQEALVSVFEKQRFTYAGLRAEVNKLARALLALGVQEGERVGIWSTNCVAWVLAQFATGKIGAILVNINPAYRRFELEFALRESQCNVLISGEGFKDDDYAQMLGDTIAELGTADPNTDLQSAKLPHLRRVVYLGNRPAAGMLSWPGLLALAEKIAPERLAEHQAQLAFDDVINIQYTSGT